MRHRYAFLFVVLTLVMAFSLTLTSCGSQTPAVRAGDLMAQVEAAQWPQTADLPESAFIASAAAFSWQLIHLTGDIDSDENQMISPASVYLALAMTLNGASSETKQAMLDVLGTGLNDAEELNEQARNWLIHLQKTQSNVSLNLSNAIWYHDTFEADADFLQTNADYYKADAHQANFADSQTTDLINQWVQDKTNGKIDSIVDEINPQTVMFLLNAIYFNADWQDQFDASETRENQFYTSDETITTDFMYRLGTIAYMTADDAEGILLPYADDRFGFAAFLPDEDTTAADWLGTLDQEKLNLLLDDREEKSLQLGLPKFESSYEASLKQNLQQLGLQSIFDPQQADFSLMQTNRQKDLYVEDVKHKTFIRVDEKGTEAAAVTSVEMRVTSMPMSDHEIIFNRPFVYFILDLDTGLPLFAGILQNPAVS